MGATAIRVIKQIIRDRRSLLMIFIVPLLITTVLFFLLGDSDPKMSIATNSQLPQVTKSIEHHAELAHYKDLTHAKEALKDGRLQTYIDYTKSGVEVYFKEDNSLYSSKVHTILTESQEKLSPDSKITSHLLYGSNLDTNFEKLSYALIVVVAFFLIFLISGISFVREQVLGTLERILLSPVSKVRLVLGYTLGFSVFGIVQGNLLYAFTRVALDVPLKGSLLFTEFIIIILSLAAVSIGMFVAIFANTEFQMVQFIPIVIIPQILYSGILPIDGLPYHLENLKFIMPIYYGATALKKVAIDQMSFSAIGYDLLAMLIITLFFTGLNALFLIKYRKI